MSILTLHQLPAAAAPRVIQRVGIALVTQKRPLAKITMFYFFFFKLWVQFGCPNGALVLFQSFQAVCAAT